MTDDQASPIRVGLIGYGFSGKTFHAPLIASVAGLELRAVSSSDAGKVQADFPRMAVHADPHALIAAKDIDLVVVATPNETHAPLARAAIVAGKHVVIDKPFTLDLAHPEIGIAVQKVYAPGVRLFDHEVFRSRPGHEH